MEYNKFKDRLGDWAPKLKGFIESEECDKIYKKLKEDSIKGVDICPDSINTFRAFRECPYNELNTVFIGMEPYSNIRNGVKAADGLAFSCSLTEYLQPSLEKFYDAIENDVYNGLSLKMERNPDLTYLANQGILLLNRSLTVRAGTDHIRSHMGLWDEFLTYVLKLLNEYNSGLIFVFAGKDAEEFESYVNEKSHYKFIVEHPSYANRQKRDWNADKVFSKINDILFKNNKKQILWDLGEVPF